VLKALLPLSEFTRAAVVLVKRVVIDAMCTCKKGGNRCNGLAVVWIDVAVVVAVVVGVVVVVAVVVVASEEVCVCARHA
jgi:hypothetical protein